MKDALMEAAAAALSDRLRRCVWRLLPPQGGSGPRNMALDGALLESAARGEAPPTLRFYTWQPPALSIGHTQSLDGIDLSYLSSRGWSVVRRPTGGRAVLHQHELTYALVLPPRVVGTVGVRTSYRVLVGALNDGLSSLVRDALYTAPSSGDRTPRQPNCFASADECDSLVPGGKVVGSAQARRGGALLQHGSILLDTEPEAWRALFGAPGRQVTLGELLGEAPPLERVVEAVIDGFSRMGVELRGGELSTTEEAQADALEPAYRSCPA